MNYKEQYFKLINSRKFLNRQKSEKEYYENHHILPRCLGGGDGDDNLVLLTAREHFVAHRLLVKIYSGKERSKLSFGLFMMMAVNSHHHRVFSSKQYEYAKQQMSLNCSGENSTWFGRKHSVEAKEKMSKRMIGKNNPQFNKRPWNFSKSKEDDSSIRQSIETFKQNYKIENHPYFGKKRSEKVKKAISNAHKGKPKSESQKEKISNSLMGRKLSDETKQKMSKSRKGKTQKTAICSYCEKECSLPTLKRWHMENCKHKT